MMPRALVGEPNQSWPATLRWRVVWRMALAVWTVSVGFTFVLRAYQHSRFPDAFTYFAAAKRLNVHHLLYQLSPGDLPIVLNPPYWSVPLLSPPFMAVAWRPLVYIPFRLGMDIWMLVLAATMLWAIYQVFAVAPAAVALAAPGLGYLLGSGNVHGYLFAALVAAWLYRDRTWPSALLGVLTAAKIMPVVFLPWLVTERRSRLLVAYFAAAAICTVVGVLGAGLEATLKYPGIMLSSKPQPISLSYLTGVSWLSPGLTVFGMVATLFLRDGRAYQMAVLTLVLFNPSGIGLAGGSLLVLLALPRGIRWSTSPMETDTDSRPVRHQAVAQRQSVARVSANP